MKNNRNQVTIGILAAFGITLCGAGAVVTSFATTGIYDATTNANVVDATGATAD